MDIEELRPPRKCKFSFACIVKGTICWMCSKSDYPKKCKSDKTPCSEFRLHPDIIKRMEIKYAP